MIKKISVFAADIDGTLAEKGGDRMPKTRVAIQRLHNGGVMIGIASGLLTSATRSTGQRTGDLALT